MTNNNSNGKGNSSKNGNVVKHPSSPCFERNIGNSGRHTDRTTSSKPGTTVPPKK